MSKEPLVGKIDNGIVIDHIPSGKILTVAIQIFGLHKRGNDGRISIGDGYNSGRLKGKKGFLKIEGRYLSYEEIDKIALIAPDATVNIIKNGKVTEKRRVSIPSVLEGLVLCQNTNCISNDSREGIYPIINHDSGVFYCHYCRQEFFPENLTFFKYL